MWLRKLKHSRPFQKAWSEKKMLTHVAALFFCIRLALRVMPYARVVALLSSTSSTSNKDDLLTDRERVRIVWAVRALGIRLLGKKPCLTQALTLQWLLRRRGQESHVCIGVRKEDRGEFMAHAWLEHDGQILIGGNQAPLQYSRLRKSQVPEG